MKRIAFMTALGLLMMVSTKAYSQIKVYMLESLRLHVIGDHQKINAKTSLNEIKYARIPIDSLLNYSDVVRYQTAWGLDSSYTAWMSLSPQYKIETIIFENMTNTNIYPQFGKDNNCKIYHLDLKNNGKVSKGEEFHVGIRNIGRCISIMTVSKTRN